MKLFQMKAEANGRNRMDDFLEHNYVCAGPAGIGDLELCEEAELKRRLAYVARDERQLAEICAEMQLFVRDMQDGDYVIIKDNDNVHLGDIGDYYYVDAFDSEEEGSCHRRGVTWLMTVPVAGIGQEIRMFLDDEAGLSALGRSISQAELQQELGGGYATGGEAETKAGHSHSLPLPDAGIISEALAILHAAMRSDDPERRERAAIAVLEYARGRTVHPAVNFLDTRSNEYGNS
jgi:predicted Mrr-cat superfamily restriction endonuclease